MYNDQPTSVSGRVFRLLFGPQLVNINQEDHYYDYAQVSLLLSGYWVTGSGYWWTSNDDLAHQNKEEQKKTVKDYLIYYSR